MRIAVVAANGRTGKIFVEHALAAGHIIRAGIRGNNPFDTHPNLTVVQCDATDQQAVEELINGTDAAACFIGHVKNSPADIQTRAIKVLASAMKKQGITRLVSLTGTGVRSEGDNISLVDRALNVAVSLIDPARVQDGKNHANYLQQTGLDWTILRVLKLHSGSPKPFTLQPHGPAKWFVSRQEVAAATLQVLEQNTYIKQAPIVSPVHL